MKRKNLRKLAVVVSISMLFAPIKWKASEYKTLPPEQIKIEKPLQLRMKKRGI